jgi:DNA modification methylase
MKLPDNEIRDITKLLEEGKPLPDKYRFLLFGDDREIELVWNGKSQEVTNVVLPFQTIEHVDEPRAEEKLLMQPDLFDLASGRQLKGWTNKLIWGDNKFVLSSLKSGPLREEIEANGGIKLIYIDPPFDIGADFGMSLSIGDEKFEKTSSVLEEIAYRDTWGKGNDSFIQMLYERLELAKSVLHENGAIVVHMGDKVAASVKLVLDEVFSIDNYRNTIVVTRGTKNVQAQFEGIRSLSVGADYLLLYTKNPLIRLPKLTFATEEKRKGKWDTFWRGTDRPTLRYELLGITPRSGQWRWKSEVADIAIKNYEKYLQSGESDLDRYYEENLMSGRELKFLRKNEEENVQYYVPPSDSKLANSVWTSLRTIGTVTDYATEKHEELSSVVVSWLTKEGDIVCDFFCGSGTTAAVAEKLGRKWITSDLGKFSIHTTRKRLIGVQRELKAQDKPFRAFEILNLGKYERQLFVTGIDEIDAKTLNQKELNKEHAFIRLISTAYKAEPISGFRTFRAKKAGRVVAIGPVDMPVSRLFAEQVVDECIEKGVTKVDLLGFEFEMGLFPSIQDEAASKGVDLVLKHIPKEVFDKRAVEKGEARFHDVAYIEIRPHFKGNSVAIELTNYSVFYTQGITSFAEEGLKNGGSQIVVENGQVIKISKDKNGFVNPREVLTPNWHDWIDYWSIDFDFTNRKEIIRVKDAKTNEVKETWTGDFIFENEWQSFRTRQDRTLELKSIFNELPPGKRKIAVKVVDIFGNDTMKVITVTIGERR